MIKSNKRNTRSLYFTERITDAMRKMLDYPITVVEAPMGYGKTTAVREHLNRCKAKVMWQRVYDNSLSSFWYGFCHVFSSFDESGYQSLLTLQFPNDSVSLKAALNIIEGIAWPEDFVIVIDDYHLVECAETNSLLEFLVTSELRDLHIVLIARYTYFTRIEELMLKGYLQKVTQESFELRPKDIITYYQRCGINLQVKDAEELYALTEGWISALYLLMLNYDPTMFSDGLTGRYMHETNIYALLGKVVYLPLSEESKDVLLHMCIFDNFTFDQAKYVSQEHNLASRLAEVVKKNAFVTYDNSERTYYIHSLLRNFLREKVENKETSYKETLYKSAALWYLEKGEYLASMRYAYLGAHFDLLLKAVELDKGRSFNSELKDLLIKYDTECPTEMKSRYPFAILVYARRMFTFNETDLFTKACAEFMAIIQKMEGVNTEQKNELLGEYELLLSFTGYNDIEKMSVYHQRAGRLLKTPSAILDKTASWTFGSPSVLYMFHRKAGQLEKEVQTIRKAMPFYYQITNDHGKGAEEVMEAERYYYMGDFVNAEIFMHKALQASTDASQAGIIICAVFLEIRLAFIKGDFSHILYLLKKSREDITRRKWYLLMHTLDMCEAYIYASLNMKEQIQPWITQGEFKNTRLFFPTMAFLNIVYGRVLLINGEYLKLIGCSESFNRTASIFPNLLGQIHTAIYLAAANGQIFRKDEALTALKQALELALPDNIYMPFVENCDYIKPLLEELLRQNIYRQEIAYILERSVSYQEAVKHIQSKYFTEDKPRLTGREREIAQLAGEGLTNKEIGERLFISQNTVKSQLKSVFEKLGINSRALLKQYDNENEAY